MSDNFLFTFSDSINYYHHRKIRCLLPKNKTIYVKKLTFPTEKINIISLLTSFIDIHRTSDLFNIQLFLPNVYNSQSTFSFKQDQDIIDFIEKFIETCEEKICKQEMINLETDEQKERQIIYNFQNREMTIYKTRYKNFIINENMKQWLKFM